MKFIELFAGIGGFRYGLEKVGQLQSLLGRPKDSGDTQSPAEFNGRPQYTCVWANEIDKYACQIYRRNYGKENELVERATDTSPKPKITKSESGGRVREYAYDCPELYEGDITKVNADDIPNHDLLTGGFPCQAFSIAGKRLGFNDTRGTLFFEIARILKAKRPKYLILENVKGLLSHDNGRTFKTILSTLNELGYDLQWQVLNSKNFGVPQNRERVFIIGHIRGERRPEVFPIGEGNSIHNGQGNEGLSKSLTATSYKGVGNDGTTLINVVGTLKGGGWEKRHEQIRRVHGIDGISPTIPTGTGGGVMTKIELSESKIRRLTPTECERLQGFPGGWTEGVSDSQRYKALGNAVTTNVIRAIGERL